MEPSSSSKVTVEYFDPSGLFPSISKELLSRLPLQNLHWDSPSRPLRSINSLHVDLVAQGQAQQAFQSVSERNATVHRASIADSVHSNESITHRASSQGPYATEQKTVFEAGTGTFQGSLRERRHQIPGLRQTPYLKIYLLRCDDNDSYKSSSRKLLREWVKQHTSVPKSSTSVNKQDNHDAFEWLILHIVLPNTAAAAQPRHSALHRGNSAGNSEKATGTSRWPGMGSSTILEKIRSDFNGSAKLQKDRVCQIRISRDHNQGQGSGQGDKGGDSKEEQEKSWMDLISKLKSSILTSFDLRVGQYEEDIREKEAQRSLPGWNFCTFFVLKEGLARAFESVGLVQDALIGYDELSAGLDAVIRDRTSLPTDTGQAGSFLPFTEDLRRDLEEAQLENDNNLDRENIKVETGGPDPLPLSATKKRYRDLILSNNISIFDFQSYVFSRQMSLSLRLANARSSRSELMAKLQTDSGTEPPSNNQYQNQRTSNLTSPEGSENLEELAKICRRAMSFITSISRTIRVDLWNGYTSSQAADTSHSATSEARSKKVSHVIDNMVASWIYSLAQQVLAETSTRALPIPPSSLIDLPLSSEKTAIFGVKRQEPKVAIPEPKTMMHPARISSLQTAQNVQQEPLSRDMLPGSASDQESELGQNHSGPSPGKFLKAGLEDLAASRAALYLLARSVLGKLGQALDWISSWDALTPRATATESSMQDVDLSDDSAGDERKTELIADTTTTFQGIRDPFLIAATQDKKSFYNLYETLSDKALRHYTVANRAKSSERIIVDLATLKFHLGDHAAVASYLHRLVPFYAEEGWSLVEMSMLQMYAKSLKKLERKDEYLRIILKILARRVAVEKSAYGSRNNYEPGPQSLYRDWSTVEETDKDHINDLVRFSQEIPYQMTMALDDYFGDIHLDSYVKHFKNTDGFYLQIRVRNVLQKDIELGKVKVMLVDTGGQAASSICLESTGITSLRPGLVRFSVATKTVIPGSYMVKKIQFELNNIVFVHDSLSDTVMTNFTKLPSSTAHASIVAAKKSSILLYPRSDALDVKLSLFEDIHLELARSVIVTILAGLNDINGGEVRLRSASAGLRLRTADSTSLVDDVKAEAKDRPGVIQFGALQPESSLKIKIPYTCENESTTISVRVEISYNTAKGDFFFATTLELSIRLPLGVNVRDCFKADTLFSTFTVSTSTAAPLRILSSKLGGSSSFEAITGNVPSDMIIFPRQPASLIYKITKRKERKPSSESENKSSTPLALTLVYRCLDEAFYDALERVFTQSLRGSEYKNLSRLLVPCLLSRSRINLTAAELEAGGLLGEISLGVYEDMKWAESLERLPLALRDGVSEWLRIWHNSNSTIYLPSVYPPESCRTIVIPMEVPQVQVVHTASLHHLSPRKEPFLPIVAIGDVLPFELRIIHTRGWDTSRLKAASSDFIPDDGGVELDFLYEIQANPDVWLIGGKRRANFRAREGEFLKFPVMLMPLRTGHLLLPNVEIRSVVPLHNENKKAGDGGLSTAGSASRSDKLTDVVTCETNYKSQAQAVLVLPDVKSATVKLEKDGGSWLVESRRRGSSMEEE